MLLFSKVSQSFIHQNAELGKSILKGLSLKKIFCGIHEILDIACYKPVWS